ncbi:MAG: alpha/beta hydrolase [Proteobacteria bacterium]|nr:alpha/beta hydrolase [Pseudomonadota bacterium]
MHADNPSLAPALPGTRRTLDSAATGLVSWYEAGPGAGSAAPLLLVHSVNAAGSAYEVRPVYEHYRARRPVYAIDLPGFGFSARTDRPYTPRLMTDALHALLAHIEREHPGRPVDALAVSLGCEFLARAAVEAPTRFARIAFVSPTGFGGRRLRRGPPGATLGRPALLRAVAHPAWRRGLFALLTRRGVIGYFLRKTWGSRDIDAGLWDYDYAVTRPPGAEFAPLRFLSGFLFSADSGTLYESLRMPVWVAHGVRGDFTDYRQLAGLADRARWRVDSFDTGALPHFEQPEAFLARCDEFLDAAPR